MFDAQFELLIARIILCIRWTTIDKFGFLQPALFDDLFFFMGKRDHQVNVMIGLLKDEPLSDGMVRD